MANSRVRSTVISIVDDDRNMLSALQRLLRSAGWNVECFDSGEAFLDGFDPSVPGCILLDVRMPGTSGFRVLSKLVARGGRTPIIFITGFPGVRTVVRAIRSGAVDVLEKPFAANEVLEAVESAVELDAMIRRESADRARIGARIAQLTPREREVLPLVLRGRLNKQIASDLGISQRTVEVHRYRIMKKMETDSVAELLSLAFRAADESLPESFKRSSVVQPQPRGHVAPSAVAHSQRERWTVIPEIE